MLVEVFSVYDSKARVYSQPFFAHNIAVAVRMFQSTIADANTNLAKHPEDYSLFHLACFNDETGAFTPRTPVNLGLAAMYHPKTMIHQPAPSGAKE